MWYIKECREMGEVLTVEQLKLPKWMKNFIYFWKCTFNKPVIRQIENGYIYCIPISLKKPKIALGKLEKICKRLIADLGQYHVKTVAISDYLDNFEKLKNTIYARKYSYSRW